MTIAIIGAGMAGLACATRLAAQGHAVTVFDKGRGPGGRMATRRAEVAGETLHFDHGAQYFTVRDERFAAQVRDWEAAGAVARWPAAGEGAWVGTPGMNAPIREMSRAQNAVFGVRIEAISRIGDGWQLRGEGAPDTLFDTVLIAVPAEQVGALALPHCPPLAQLATNSVSDPCWTLMVAFDHPLDAPDTLRHAGAIGWAARNSAKPGRSGGECWVIQGSTEWSRAHLEDDAAEVIRLLLEAFANAVGASLPPARHTAVHRWRYAMSGGAGLGAFWDAEQRLGACGDWLLGPRIENAFLSGYTLAERVLGDG